MMMERLGLLLVDRNIVFVTFSYFRMTATLRERIPISNDFQLHTTSIVPNDSTAHAQEELQIRPISDSTAKRNDGTNDWHPRQFVEQPKSR